MKLRRSRLNQSVRATTAPVLLLSLAAIAWIPERQTSQPGTEEELVLLPFITESIYQRVTLESQVLLYYPGPGNVQLLELVVDVDGYELYREDIAGTLTGDRRYGELAARLDRLPHDLTELHRDPKTFAAFYSGEDAGRADREVIAELRRESALLTSEYAAGTPSPLSQPHFRVHLDQIFTGSEAPGTEARVRLTVNYINRSGVAASAVEKATLTWRGPRPRMPISFGSEHAGSSLHIGDLHVHSCVGEASGACSPHSNCTAETLQTSGSFTYAQLKSQYQALGLDWFTATDHSYCITSDGEYALIVANTAALTDPSFLVLPDIELSSDEEGSQVGSDLGDVICLGTTSANHMGAHNLSSRIAGGDDGFLGFCDGLFGDALDGFQANVQRVRSQGGLPIINHPDGSSFAWNSRAATRGIEQNALHGVEIWNDAFQSGQGGGVGAWVDWLLDDRLLYAYSGSDTHDQAFDFGANHVLLLDESFSSVGLYAALEAGRVYISNGPALIFETQVGGSSLLMGERHLLPNPVPAALATLRAHYDFGSDSGTIEFFGGKAGDASETSICTSGLLSGSGTFECTAPLNTGGQRSWFRAYAINQSANRTAYSNPVFFERGAPGDTFTYCTAKTNSLGCLPAITAHGSPSATAGFGFLIGGEDILAAQNGLMIYGYGPMFLPFQGATLCVAGPQVRTPIQHSGGTPGTCEGAFSFDFNQRIASGADSSLVVGATAFAQYWYRDPMSPFPSGLTDGLQFTIGL